MRIKARPKHRELTRALAAAIEAQYGEGSVWWDQALESWGDYEIQIRNALNEARVVVVIWTKAAGESDWVKSEAGRANRDGKLVNVRPTDTMWRDVPSPYDQHHVNKLDDIDGILKSIAAVWSGRPIRTTVPGYMVTVAIETPGKLIELLDNQVPKLDENALAAIDAALPLESLTLMELALHVAARRVDLARKLGAPADTAAEKGEPEAQETILAHLAARVATLGVRLSALGRREEALAAGQEAVASIGASRKADLRASSLNSR